MQIIHDTINFMKSLSFIDVVFFLAVLALMLLIIILIYFIKENDVSFRIIEEEPEEEKKVLKSTEDEINSLMEISKAIEEAEPQEVNLTKYEEEQEEKAIISYEELLKKKNDFAINYSDEKSLDDDLTIKKIDLHNFINKEEAPIKHEIKVELMPLDKEEAFLKALKQLQKTLN